MSLSIVIRTRGREERFRSLLVSLASQTLQPSELVVVNNYSSETDEVRFKDYLAEDVRRIFETKPPVLKSVALSDSDFSHAYSTNIGVAASASELVCITNAHSLPISKLWLEQGMKHFKDGAVAGMSGFFIPHGEGAAIASLDRAMYRFTQRNILKQDWCSTINCIIRKRLWKEYPFDENLPRIIPETRKYGLEDYDWSKEMTARGYKIIIDSKFSVYHSHRGPIKEAARNVKGYFIYRALQQKIDGLKRPRQSFSRASQTEPTFEILALS